MAHSTEIINRKRFSAYFITHHVDYNTCDAEITNLEELHSFCIQSGAPMSVGCDFLTTLQSAEAYWVAQNVNNCVGIHMHGTGTRYTSVNQMLQGETMIEDYANEEPITSNGLVAGMLVRYIGPESPYGRPETCKIIKVYDYLDEVEYREGFACAARFWEPIENKGEEMEDHGYDVVDTHKKAKTDAQPEHSTPSTLEDRYNKCLSEMSKASVKVNESYTMLDMEKMGEVFIKTKQELHDMMSHSDRSIFGKIMKAAQVSGSKNRFVQKLANKYNATTSASRSTQRNIDEMFGVLESEYKRLIEIAETIHESRQHFKDNLKELRKLEVLSDEEISGYSDILDIPIADLATNTKIKSAIKKYEQRLLKVDGVMMATRATIVTLGQDMPNKKSDLSEEMALGALLNNIDRYQEMYKSVSKLIEEVTEDTAQKVHTAVENLMKIQIEDTHLTRHLASSVERAEDFAKMLEIRSEELKDKVVRDAKFIREVASGTAIEDARRSIKLLD